MKMTARSRTGVMLAFDGVLARKLDFADVPAQVTSTVGWGRTGLYLASRPCGPDKYRALEARRRAAQLRARRLLDRIERED